MAWTSSYKGNMNPPTKAVPQKAPSEVQCYQDIEQASQHVQVEITSLAN